MKKVITAIHVDGNPVEYRLIRRRGHRSFTLSVHQGGRVTLTVPRWVSEKKALEFVQKKEAWLREAVRKAPKEHGHSLVNRAEYLSHKEKAREFVQKRLEELNAQYGFVYKKVCIRMNKSRWGSCSTHGTLNFDYRILFLPPQAQDYLLVHELCHLKEMNHSERFWHLVARAIPNYKVARATLRRRSGLH